MSCIYHGVCAVHVKGSIPFQHCGLSVGKGLCVYAPSLLSIDIFVYTQFGDTYKWQRENRDRRKLTPIRVLNTNNCKPPTQF